MILSFSGRIGSGKSTAGEIVQELYPDMNWQVKGFADKLRQIASIFLGIPPEGLKKQEVKEQVLGPEWGYFLGKYESIETPHVFSSTTKHANLESCKSFNAGGSVKCIAVGHHQMTVRQFLQELGTQGVRDGVHPNSWVNALMCDYKPHVERKFEGDLSEQYWCSECRSCHRSFSGRKRQYVCNECIDAGFKEWPNWLITDCRYLNEIEAIKSRGGTCFRIIRPDNPHPQSAHESETAIDHIGMPVIINDGNLEQLKLRIREAVEPIIKNLGK